MKKYATRLAALLTCLSPVFGWGAQIGGSAPPLVVKEWLKGKPVQIQPGTNIYVVEVWASWSFASRLIITNLNQIQQRFADRGVVVIAISDEPIEKLKEFLAKQGTNIEYAVAADDSHQTARSYMIPAHQQGLPYAFIVGTNGNLLWHDRPTGALSNVLDQVITGRFDIVGAGKSWAARHQMEQYLAMASRKDPRARAAGRTLLTLRTNDVELLCDFAYQIAIHPLIPKGDISLATEALNQAERLATTNKLRVELTRAVLLFETGKTNEAFAQAREGLASAKTQEEKEWAQSSLRTMESRMALQGNLRRRAPTRKQDSEPTNSWPTSADENGKEANPGPGAAQQRLP